MSGKLYLSVLLGVVVLVAPSFGQTFGQISGVVYDSTGAVVPGVTITVTNPQTNFTRTAVSNESGYYNFPALPPELYNVKAEIAGFQSEVRNSVQLQVQQTARIDFRLSVGSVNETVQVEGGAPLLNTENATVGTVIEQKRIEDLPINGRSFISLIALSPNVTSGQTSVGGFAGIRGGSARGDVSIAVAGNRREYNYYTLDGVSNTEVDFNTYAFLPSIDALQEFKVQTGIYSAEFGREVSQINVSTRGGTNAYHGTVFEFLRNNALDARPYAFTRSVPASAPFKWNQYGFTLGGPVQIPKVFNGKNSLFFFSNYEGFRLRAQAQQVFSTPPAAMRRGDFSAILPGTVIRDPKNNNQPFPGNIIPTDRLHRIALGLLEFYPLPNIPGAGLANNYLALQNNLNDKDQFTQRMDYVENAKSNWFGRYSWQDEYKVAQALYQNGNVVTNNIGQAMISNTRIFSPTLVNEFHFGWLGYHNIILNELAYKRDVTKELNIPVIDPPPIAWGSPSIGVAGFSGFGDNLQGPFATHNHTFQWKDGLTWTHGAHTMKFGAEIRRDRYNDVGNQGARPQLAISPQATGYGFSDYMLGYVNTSSQAGALANIQLRGTTQAYYATDNWKLRPNVTVEFGLRYEYTQPWNSKNDTMTNTIVPVNVDGFFTPGMTANLPRPYLARNCAAYGQTDFYPPNDFIRFPVEGRCVTGYGSTTLINPDRTNFAPRLGIAWSPTSKWTIRLGSGIFYAQDSGNSYLDMGRTLTGKISNTTNIVTHDLTFDNPFTVSPGTTECGVPSPPYICISSPGVNATDPNLRTAYVVQSEFNVQRQLSGSTALEIGYLGSQGHRLLTRWQVSTSIEGPGAALSPSRVPYPEYANIQTYAGLSFSNYNAVSVKLTRRLSQGLSFLAGYTFSKSLDASSAVNPANGAAIRAPQNGWCVRCEYGLSDFDTRHRFVSSMLFELPVGRGKRFLNHGIASTVLGGWQLNSINTISSGFPLTWRDGINQSNSNQANDRPWAIQGVGTKLDNPTTDAWFNIQSVRLQPVGFYGNVGRNTVLGPGFWSWDFSTLKNFNFTEGTYLQFRFECFNCANHPALGDPNTTLSANRLDASGIAIPGTGALGTITNTRPGIDMRQLQFSLKLKF
jgi:Carboxypeptidase regulatory-like domain